MALATLLIGGVMRKTLVITNILLGIIALCLVVLVGSIYDVGASKAYAQPTMRPAPVVLMYWDDTSRTYKQVVTEGGYVRTTK